MATNQVGTIQYDAVINTDGLDKGLNDAHAKLGRAGDSIKKYAAVGVAAVGAFTGVVVKSFAEYEQLVGGVEKIFDQANQTQIFADAQNAYKNLNISASQYLTAINQVGAAFASTMGDQKGYDVAKQGMQAIADYASGTGRNIDELNQKYQLITRSTSSYQSIADQFSGILPQTSKDFLEQAKAAGLLSESYTELSQVPIDEYQIAVTSMLEKGTAAMGLAGNTAAETAGTISGAFAATKASISNTFAALGTGDAEMVKQSMNALAESAGNLVRNVLAILPGIFSSLAEGLRSMTENIPILGEVVGGVISLIEFIVRNKDVFLPIVAGILAIIAAIKVWTAVTTAYTLVQAALNVVMAANPIGIIILAIIGLVAAIMTLWHTNEGFRDFFKGAWEAISNAVKAVWNWIKDNWPLLLAILLGPIGIAVTMIIKHWDTIKSAFASALDFIKSIWSTVTGFFSGVWNGIKGVFGSVGSFFGGIVNTIVNAFSGIGAKITGFFSGLWSNIGNGLKNILNSVLHLPLKIPSVNIPGIGSVGGQTLIPAMAKGGIVTGPTTALIGEAGREAVLPLDNNTGWMDDLAEKIGGTGNATIIVKLGEETIATKVIDLINDRTNLSGRNSILV